MIKKFVLGLFVGLASFFTQMTFADDPCISISEVYKRDSCYVSLAAKTQNKALCEHVKTEPFQDLCKQSTEGGVATQVIKGGDTKQCENLDKLKKRNCITLMAKNKKDESLCRHLNDAEDGATCYSAVAEQVGSIEPCSKVEIQIRKYTCALEVISKFKRKSDCAETEQRLFGRGAIPPESDLSVLTIIESCKSLGYAFKK